MELDILILAFYLFTPFQEPKEEVKRFQRYLSSKDAKGRIYLSHEGINAQMSIARKDAPDFFDWLFSDERFKNIEIKVHEDKEHAFSKLKIKFRKQLVALDQIADSAKGGMHVSPEKWKEMLENRGKDTLILDVRNDYEWQVGHFEGAEKPALKTFREFPQYAEKLKKEHDPEKTQVMMYCTGGIRCELYSSVLKEKGFKNVVQLEGGVINYGLKVGARHWLGDLFVFDDRLVVPIDPKEKRKPIARCFDCQEKTDLYVNCANMDCNQLFLCCKSCLEKWKGCCSPSCIEAPRVRAFAREGRPRPFKRLPYEEKKMLGKG